MKTGEKIATLTLNPSIDHILTVDALSLYNKNILTGKQTFYGGKGINTAFTLGKLGIPTTAVGLIGANDLVGVEKKCQMWESITRSYQLMEAHAVLIRSWILLPTMIPNSIRQVPGYPKNIWMH
jgi:hypothetical protein